MRIVDKQHGSELITDKGKVLKFDAIECMTRYITRNSIGGYKCLVNTYDRPARLCPVDSVTFVISKSLPSPMGAFLTGFSEKNTAVDFVNKNDGQVFSWNQILASRLIPAP